MKFYTQQQPHLAANINAKSGNYNTITTGKDDNKDGAINDRPPGVRKNTEFVPHYFNGKSKLE